MCPSLLSAAYNFCWVCTQMFEARERVTVCQYCCALHFKRYCVLNVPWNSNVDHECVTTDPSKGALGMAPFVPTNFSYSFKYENIIFSTCLMNKTGLSTDSVTDELFALISRLVGNRKKKKKNCTASLFLNTMPSLASHPHFHVLDIWVSNLPHGLKTVQFKM